MSDAEPSPLSAICAELSAAYVARDTDRYVDAMNALEAAASRSEPAEVDAALPTLVPILREARLGRGGGLPAFAFDLAEHAGGPGPLLPVLVDRAVEALTGAAAFAEAAARLGVEAPDPADRSAAPDATAAFTAAGGAPELAAAWFAANDWTRPVLWWCNRADVRADLPRRAELTAAVEAAGEHVSAAGWLRGLLRVLDDELLPVLHRSTGRAFRVTIGGVSDNFQLHMLLAVHLVGTGLIPGTPPSPSEAAAATDGEVQPAEVLKGRFDLVDASGDRVWNEGVPADIPVVDGERVLVLDEPPRMNLVWGTGRIYPNMVPSVTVEPMPDAESIALAGRVSPPTGR